MSSHRVKVTAEMLGGVADGINMTGSCILITIRRGKKLTRIMLDVGAWQGNPEKAYQRNVDKLGPYAKIVDHVILTHAHNDHAALLPLLTKLGFNGRVFCTKPTLELLSPTLLDTAKVLAAEALYLSKRAIKTKAKGKTGYFNRSKERRTSSRVKPYFETGDVTRCLALVKNSGIDFGQWTKIEHGIEFKFYPSGHVLGGAICIIKVQSPSSQEEPYYFGFSGDLGRKDGIILPPPATIREPLNVWFTESTYGGKVHPSRDEEIATLLETIRQTVANKGRILIPSFSLERTQEIVWLLTYHMEAGDIPRIPIYLDSPLASKITSIFSGHWSSKLFSGQEKLKFNPFCHENKNLWAVESHVRSAELTKEDGPYLVVAGAGMCDAGRIRNYLRAHLGNHKTCVCLIGHMSLGSLGWKLKNGQKIVKMNGEEIYVRAKIVAFDSFSAHADGPFLVEYATQTLTKIPRNNCGQTVVIIHGEEESGLTLKQDIRNAMGNDWPGEIIIPAMGDILRFI